MEVLNGWRAFVEASGIAKSRIKAAEVHEHQQIKLSRTSLQENDQGFCLALSDAQASTLKGLFTKSDEQGRIQADPLQLGFPLLRITESSKTFFIPLFRYSLPDTWHSDETRLFTVPVKQGLEVTPNIEAFRQYLDVDIQELGAERHMMSIAAACMEGMQESFGELFKAFLLWVKRRLRERLESPGKSLTASLERAFTAIIGPEVNSDFNTNTQLKDYDVLLQRSDLQALPLLQQYIQHRSDERISLPSSTLRPPYGLFERQYPLGRGQMMALAQVSSGASLLAVQGAPGTGKTTLFKSLIASQIVERALACIGGNDRNLGLVVTSTAKKAVENVIDDLRGDAYLKDINWLYFQGGDSTQITNDLQRTSALLKQLDSEVFDHDKQKALAAQITEKKRVIDACLNRFESLKKQVEVAAARLSGVSPEDYEMLSRTFSEELSQRCSLFGLPFEPEGETARHCTAVLEDLGARRTLLTRAKRWLLDSYGKLVGAPFPLERYRDWLDSSLSTNLQHHFAKYPTSGLRLLITKWFGRKYRAAHTHLRQAYPEDFNYYGLDGLDQIQLARLARHRKELFAQVDTDELLKAAGWWESDAEREKERALKQILADIAAFNLRSKNLQAYKEAKRVQQEEFPEGDWLEVLRMRFIVEQRALFESAIDYLWQEMLLQKDEVCEVLPLWSSLVSNQQDSGYYKWKDKLDDFYRIITLVYPVMASTLASVHKLAGYKLSDLNGSTPYQLSLVDEAGMISVESLVPLLARSQRAIVVGDPLQIEPIRSLDKAAAEKLKDLYFESNTLYEAVSPMLVTAYHRAAGTLTGGTGDTGNGIVLDEHRRCQKPIAKLFMSIADYKGVQIRTATPDSRIQAAFNNMGGFNLMFYGVQGQRGLMPNTNQDEVEAIGWLLDKLETAGYDLTQDVGIITPYSNQKSLLIKAYGERLKHSQTLKIGSVHQFQGVEFEVIIYSPVIFRRTDRDAFQNGKPNLLNVAVSRAKQQFIVVGNHQRLTAAGKSLSQMAKICSESFFVNMEHQSPFFENVRTRGARQIFDCEHITTFESLIASSRHSFTVVTPWIRKGFNTEHPPLKMLQAAQDRGVAVTIYYGYDRMDRPEADDGDPELILDYRRYLGDGNVIRLPEGTHEKILLVDDQVATVGSWNWLSHSYYRYCSTPGWKNLSLRRETSIELRDPQLIAQLKSRIAR